MKRTFRKYPTSIKASEEAPYDAEGTMSPEMAQFVTSEGRKAISMFKKYGLLGYYDPMAGAAAVPTEDFESLKSNIMRLIKENEGWVLGYGQQTSGYEEDFWYITDYLE